MISIKHKRVDKGDKIHVKAGAYYAYDGTIRRSPNRFMYINEDEIGDITDVVVEAIDELYSGRHLIVRLSCGLVDIWTSQDQFCYRRVKG